MGVLKLVKAVRNVADVPATLHSADPWAVASEDQRREATLREELLAPLAALVEQGSSINHVAALFVAQVEAGRITERTARLLVQLGHADGLDEAARCRISAPTLKRWLSAYRVAGCSGLLPRHTGRVRQDYGWEALAVQLYNQPSKPGYADVSCRLRELGHPSATDSRVKRYIKSMPATLGEFSPARVGPGLHKLTRQNFQRRSTDGLLVGEIYAGDGHTVDCYVAHPSGSGPYRPELTVWIDVRSRYIVGWWVSESESAHSTLFALSSAMQRHDHVPGFVYVDRGPGYRAKVLSDEHTGFYARFDIEVIGALPGNPHGKGWIERFFREARDKHDKFFADGQVYCGDDMAPETNRRLSADLKMGRRKLPSVQDYVASFTAWLEHYHDEPMKVLNGRTPRQVWAELTPVVVGTDADCIARPHERRTVNRNVVRLDNRFYFHEALALYEAKDVDVEYDLHNDRMVRVFDLKGRLVCDAKLTNTIGVLPSSRLEEQRKKREAGQLKRLDAKAREIRLRAQDAITVADTVAAIESLTPAAPEAAPRLAAQAEDITDIDILSWRDDQ